MKTEKFMMILLVLLISMSISLGVVSAGAIDDSSVYSANNSDLAAISVVSVDSSISDNGTLQSDVSSLNEAKNYYVSDLDGDDANDGLSKETAVKTIAKAYNLSEDGSIINIGSGVYYSTSSVAVDKSISFIGDGDVVLNKSGASIFTVPSGSTANVLFKNLTFINEVVGSGNPLLNIGGGISTISDCNFTNICAGKNGMIKFYGTAIGLVENCVFSDSNSTGGSNSYIYLLGNSEVDISKSKFINLTHNGYLRSIIYVYAENATLNVNDVLFDGISGDMYGIVENKGQANLYNVTISNSVLSGSYTNSLITSSETNAAKASSTLVNHTLFINNSAVADVSSKACPMNVEYSSFLDNNKAIMNNEATVSANYNWYGTNKKENINVENVTINNWALLTVEPVSIEAHVGDKISISAEILSYEDNEGNVNELAESIPVYASFSAVSGEFDSEESLGDSEADSEYTATVEGNDVITVSSGSESFEIPVTVTASSDIVITDDNYADYFDLANNGTIVDGCGIVDGTTVYISNVTNKVFTFDKSVNVVGLEGDKISNGYIHLVAGASGSNITGVTIINDVISISTGNGTVSLHGIWLTSVENCTISNNFVQTSVERTVFAMPFTNASYNVIANNTIMGGASTCMPMGASSHNIITDNYLSSVGANIIYYNPFGHADYSSSKYPGANNYNVISNNVLNGTNGTMSSWCYAIQLMTGNYATIVNNTVTNAFLGISLPGGANSTVRGNKLSNIGSIAITVGSVGVEIVDNVIDVNETGISISKDGLTVSGNKINTNGVGINITKGGNVTIVENNVTTTGAYAIDLMSTSGNIVTDNYLVATDLTGDKAVKTTGENIITGNIPVPGPKVYNLTNETFFNYFDSDGILLSNIKVNDTLNFIGEFSDLPGVNAITISNSIVMNGVDAILKDIAIQTTGTLTGGLVINNFTIINTGVNAGMLIYDSNVTISNNTIIVVSDGTTDATALSAYVANNLVLVDNSVEFNASDKSKTNNAVVIDLSNDVLVSGNEFIVNVPSADIDWSQYPLTIVKSAGLVFTSCDDLIFTGNDVLVSNSTEGSGYNTIYGVNVKGGSDVEISNNTIMTTGHYAYSLVVAGYMDDEYNSYPVEDFTVSDNIIIAEGGAYACGLNLEGPANGNVTSNNISAKATSVAYPVYGSGMSGVLAVDYSNNTIYGFANSVYGMELMGRAETVIDNNITVEGNFTIGIASTSGTSSSGIVIKRNNINTKGEGKGTPTTGDSISSENVGIKIVKYGGNKFGTIEGNNITSTGSYAINLETTSGSVVSDNYLVGANFTGDDAVAGTGVNTIENNRPKVLTDIVITDDNYADYFDLANNGTIVDGCGIVDGTTVYISNVTNKVFTFDKSVNVVGLEGDKISNGYIHLVAGASGSNITGVTIISNATSISTGNGTVSLHGIWLSNVENCTISNNFVQTSVERTVFAMPFTNASYNVIANNTIMGGASTCMPMGASSYNIITDNYLSSVGANIIYYNPYGHADYSSSKYPGANNYNVISNNVLNGTTGTMSSWCYAIQLMTGNYATIVNNTVTNAFLGISLPGGANSTVRGNKLSNIGSIAITVASEGVEIVDNVIDVNKTGISISKAGLTVSGNQINTNGVGINITKGGNVTIVENNVTTTGAYAIDLMSTSGNIVTDNYLVAADLTGDEAVKTTGENTIIDNVPKPVSNIVTNETFFDFFDENGTLKDGVPTNLIFKGEFANLTGSILHIVINKPVSIVCEDVVLRDIGIHLVEGSSGSNLTGFSIVSNKTSNGIWLSDSNYNHITNCSINLIGSGKYAMPLIRSSYNVIDSCNIYENGGSVLVLCYANNNNITNCDIKSASSNVVYINCYDILDFKSGVNGTDYGYNNSFVNNNVSGVATAFCIGFQIMGSDNKFINNTVKGTSSAFSVPAPNKWANYTNTGNYFEGNTIVNCSNGILLNTVGNSAINNTVVNSGSGVSASVSAVIVGNNIISNGTNVGIKLTGSDMIVENNTIITASGVGISSTKDNNTITGNNISTGADYAITLGSGSSNIVVDNYLVAKDLKGNLAVSGTGVNTIENNTPMIGIVTNDTFFNFFDENGILKDDVPTDLIFQGEFANLNGNISHIVVNRPVSIKGDKAVLNNMTMQFIDGANGSVVDNLTFINYINSYALVDLENVTDVIISNNNFTSYGNSSRCVLLNNATGCEVLNNEMFMNSSAYNSRAVLIGGNSSFNNISSNNIKVADFNGVDINPYVGGGHDNLVFNNTITSIADNVSSWNYAIQLGGPNNTAMNNTIYNVYMGICSVTGGYESIIVGNHITNLTGSFMSGAGGNAGGLAISAGISNIIENNTIVDEDVINGGINAGINSVVSGNIINVNILDNNGINAGNGSVVKNNSVTCNFTNKQMINAMYDIIIANNTIISSNGTGIFIQATSSGNFVIEGNVINITNGNSPVVNIKCSNATIKDNNISVASGVGINSIKDNNTITGNNISTGADYAITLGSGSSNIVVDNYLVAKYLKGNLAVSGTGVNTIENNTPVIGIVTNDTFFNFFDENGILKDDVPTDLIFQGEFEGLPGIVAIIISKSVVMNGIDAVLKNISIMTSANLTDGLLINNFTIINDINNAGIVIVDSNVIVSNNTIKVNSDGTTNANAICAYAANNLTLTNNIVEFTAKNSEFINSLLLIEDSANVLVDGNDFIADVPSANIDWYETPALVKSTGLMFSSCDNLTLTNNDIAVANSTVGVGYNTIYGVYSRGGSDNTIANNTINTRGHYAYSLIVGGTSYYDDEEEEFVVKEAKNAIVENNEIIANGGTYACGLKLEGPANVNVSSNNIAASATDVSYPVYSEGYNGALYADYVNNTIYGKASSVYGMELMGLGETVLDNNITVEGNFTMGIGSTSGSSSSGVVIKRNNIVVKGEGKGTPTTGDMIPAENVGIKVISDGSNKFALIEDNNISSTGKYAVNLSSTSGSTVINNYLVANPTIGDYAVYGTGVNTVKNNTPTYTGIIYVSPDGDDLNMGSEDAPVATIAKAIELATVEGGSNHIILAEGTYNENNLDVSETNLAIEGAGIDKTIIDASGKDGEIFNSYLSNLELSNLTLANAVNSDMSGGAVLSMGNLTLDTVKIINCTADENNGGAIYAVGSVEIINSIIANNTGKTGGAIYLDSSAVVGSDSSLVIKDSVFENNTAEGTAYGGGAIYMQKVDGGKSIENTSFVNNTAVAGGAIFMQQSAGDFDIIDSSFINNTANGPSANYGGGALNLIGSSYSTVGNVNVDNCVFENNTASNTTRGGGAVLDRNVDLTINNSVLLNNNDANNTSVYKDTTSYSGGGKVSLTNDWWGTNNPENLTNTKVDSWVVMSIYGPTNVTFGDDINMSVALDKLNDGSDYTGVLPADYETTLAVNGSKLMNITIPKGESVAFELTVDKTGDYVVSAINPITGVEEVNKTVTVNPKEVPIDVTVDDVSYGDNITGSIGTPINGTVSVIINDTVYNGTVEDGNFNIDASNLTVGNYSDVPMHVVSDDGTIVANANINITINKIGVVIVVKNASGTTTQNITVVVNVTDVNGKPLDGITLNYTVSNSNVTGTVEVVNGTVAKIVLIPVAGNYVVNVSFEGNENYANASAQGIVKVTKTATKFVSPSSGAVYNGNYYKVTLKDASGKVLASKEVQIKLLGKVYNVTTNANGVAKVKIAATNAQIGKSLNVIYKFAGDSTYSASSGSSTIKVVKTPTVITKVTTGAVKNHGYFYVKLTTKAGKALANKVITMKSANTGKTYKLKTNANGIAKTDLWVKVKPLGKYYSYTFSYAGSSYYKPCSATFKVKIV